ncbi:MAG: hypothetical protein KAS93_06375 [Gammaproteobacteria bacterium]|nr:hypothetical protein [Gammaproteobacteria bacterium]
MRKAISAILPTLLVLISQTVLATAPLSLRSVNLSTNTAIAGKTNTYVYALQNNKTTPIKIKIYNSDMLRVIPRIPTCMRGLPAHGICSLTINFTAPKKLGITKTFLNIASNGNHYKLPITFRVTKKYTPNKNIVNTPALHFKLLPNIEGTPASDIAIDPTNNNILYAALWGGGIYKSINAGQHWTKMSSGPGFVVQIVLVDNAIYAISDHHGIYKSTDGGNTWAAINTGLPLAPNQSFIYVSDLTSYNNTLYAATTINTLYSSTNGGASWQHLGNIPRNVIGESLLITKNIMLIGTDHSVYQSTDNGKTWQQHIIGLPNTHVTSLFYDKNTGAIFAGSYNLDENTKGVYKSIDGGNTWKASASGLDGSIVVQKSSRAFAKVAHTLYVATIAGTNDEQQEVGGGLYKSTDEGNTWTHITGLGGNTIWSINATNTQLYAANSTPTFGGIFTAKVSDDNYWNIINSGINETSITALHATTDGSLFAGSQSGAVFKLGNKGWIYYDSGLSSNGLPIYNLVDGAPGTIFAGTLSNLFSGSDTTNSWKQIDLPDLPNKEKTPVNSIYYNNGTIYLGTEQGILASKDNGETWNYLNVFQCLYAYIGAIRISGDNIYAITGSYVFKNTTKGGQPWITVTSNLPLDSNLLSLLTSTAYPGMVLVGSNKGLYLTNDGGKTWTESDQGMPTSTTINKLLSIGNVIIAGTNNGVFISLDGAKTWSPANKGLPSIFDVHNLTTDGHYVFIATNKNIYEGYLS